MREADNIFHQWNDPAFKQEFRRNDKGEMEVTVYYTTHAPYTLTRGNVDWSGFDYKSLNGRFTNGETGVSLNIRHLTGKQYRVITGAKETTGLLVSPTRLLVDFYHFEIKPGKNETDTLLLNGDRIRKVRFLREKG